MVMLATALCGCSGNTENTPDNEKNPASTVRDGNDGDNKNDGQVGGADILTDTYEIAATDPHYIISVPAWRAEGYGYGFALNEKDNKDYAVVVACGYGAEDKTLQEAFSVLYNDNFKGILMQNYRAKYAEFTPETKEVKLADGSTALQFDGLQPADDYGTEMSCPIYGYGFSHEGVPFIVAYIVMKESSADEAKRAEMQRYVDAMVNTVRTAQ